MFFLVVFLVVSSLELPSSENVAHCAKETLIKEWDTRWTKSSEGYISWVGQFERKRAGGESG